MRFLFLILCCSMGTAEDGPITFRVDLAFGADEAEEVYLWSSGATSVSADERGHMFVSDPGENRVLEFDTEGRFVRLVASEGKGPGEFQALQWFSLLMDGSAMGYELVGGNTAKIHYFGKDMRFQEATSKQMILELATLSPTGRHLAGFFVTIDPEDRQVTYETGVFNASLAEIKPVTRETGPLHDRSRFQEPGYWAERLGQNMKRALKGEGVFHFDRDGMLYSAVTNRYEVTAWNPDLKTVKKTFKRDYKPILQSEAQLGAMIEFLTDQLTSDPFLARIITPGVMQRAIELSEPPPVKNPIYGMVTMEDGTLLVVHNVDLISREHLVDVFTLEGEYRGQITFPDHAVLAPVMGGFLPRMTFRNGYAYTIQTDEMGDNRVVRYRYKIK